jgi:hypothetical protein
MMKDPHLPLGFPHLLCCIFRRRLMNLIDYKVSRDGETLSPEDVLTLLRGTGAAQYADVNLLDVALSQLKQAALQVWCPVV